MIRKLIYLLILALWPLLNLKAQVNLVPNPSFEDTLECPDFSGQLNRVARWSSPTNGTPDIITANYCNTYVNSSDIGVPENNWGFQSARTGNNYIGIGLYNNSPDGYIEREYVQVRLNDILKSGIVYCVQFYTVLADKVSSYAIKNIGAYFSTDSVYVYNNLPFLPILNFPTQIQSTEIVLDTLNWTKISGYFTANGGEKYILLGNFTNQEAVDTLYIPNQSMTIKGAYYYIDDVSVYECDSLIGINEESVTPIQIYPNPANGMVTIQTMQAATIKLYNATGQLVLQSTQPQIDCSPLPNGLYVVQVQQGNTISYKRLVIQH